MMSILNMLSPEQASDQKNKVLVASTAAVMNRYEMMKQQPMLLSAVEATLSSFFKDEGDALLDYFYKNKIFVFFDDNLSEQEGSAYYVPEDNTIVLSSKPDDILDISKEFFRVLTSMV